jgi:hypothetical protein
MSAIDYAALNFEAANGTALDWALAYASIGMLVFPVRANKEPLVCWGTTEPATASPGPICSWWAKWPSADVGWALPGEVVVLDLDLGGSSRGIADFERLEGASADLIETPQSLSPSGGRHLFFLTDGRLYRNWVKPIPKAGIDVRTAGGMVILPSPGNGRIWLKPLTLPMVRAPGWVPIAGQDEPSEPREPRAYAGETRYGNAMLATASRDISSAPNGCQESTLHRMCFTMGGLVAGGVLSYEPTFQVLLDAANRMPTYGKPWKALDKKVKRSLGAGMNRPIGLPPADPSDYEDEGYGGRGADGASGGSSGNSGGSGKTAHHAAPQEEWPEPRPIRAQLFPVKPFDREMLPKVLGDYAVDISERQQCALDFPAVVAVVSLGAMLGNRVRLRPKAFDDWEVVANPWGAIIGRPAAMKSPALKAGLAPVFSLQKDLREEWKAGLKEGAVEATLAAILAKKGKKEAAKQAKENDLAGARRILAGLTEEGERPPRPRLVVNDSSIEKLGELLNHNPRGLLLLRDELQGWLSRLQDEQFEYERKFYLECSEGHGPPFSVARIGRGELDIENLTLSVIGGIQPSSIARLVRAAVDGSNDDGLVQRLQLAVWPDDRGSWVWTDRKPAIEARLAYEDAFRRVRSLGRDDLRVRFDPEAQELFQAFCERLYREALSNRFTSIIESHMLKMPKTIASLALIFEAVEVDAFRDGQVRKASFERARKWAKYLFTHAQRLYQAADAMAENGARLILRRRAKLPEPFTARHVQRRGWAGLTTFDLVEAAIGELLATDHCHMRAVPTGPFGGRPTEEYRWNPRLGKESVS